MKTERFASELIKWIDVERRNLRREMRGARMRECHYTVESQIGFRDALTLVRRQIRKMQKTMTKP